MKPAVINKITALNVRIDIGGNAFQLQNNLGEGSFGSTWRITLIQKSKVAFAIKIYKVTDEFGKPHRLRDSERRSILDSYDREVRAHDLIKEKIRATSLSVSSNFALYQYHGPYGKDGKYLLMQLYEPMLKYTVAPDTVCMNIFNQVLGVILLLETLQLMHGDFKLDNLCYAKDNKVVLGDLATVSEISELYTRQITQTVNVSVPECVCGYPEWIDIYKNVDLLGAVDVLLMTLSGNNYSLFVYLAETATRTVASSDLINHFEMIYLISKHRNPTHAYDTVLETLRQGIRGHAFIKEENGELKVASNSFGDIEDLKNDFVKKTIAKLFVQTQTNSQLSRKQNSVMELVLDCMEFDPRRRIKVANLYLKYPTLAWQYTLTINDRVCKMTSIFGDERYTLDESTNSWMKNGKAYRLILHDNFGGNHFISESFEKSVWVEYYLSRNQNERAALCINRILKHGRYGERFFTLQLKSAPVNPELSSELLKTLVDIVKILNNMNLFVYSLPLEHFGIQQGVCVLNDLNLVASFIQHTKPILVFDLAIRMLSRETSDLKKILTEVFDIDEGYITEHLRFAVLEVVYKLTLTKTEDIERQYLITKEEFGTEKPYYFNVDFDIKGKMLQVLRRSTAENFEDCLKTQFLDLLYQLCSLNLDERLSYESFTLEVQRLISTSS